MSEQLREPVMFVNSASCKKVFLHTMGKMFGPLLIGTYLLVATTFSSNDISQTFEQEQPIIV